MTDEVHGVVHDGVTALRAAIPENATLLLDTSALVAYFGREDASRSAALVVDTFVRSARNRAVVSTVTAMELLVRPRRAGRADLESRVVDFLVTFPNVQLVPVDLTVARVAAALRAQLGLKPPDALVAATGLDRAAAVAISDDTGWPGTIVHGGATMRVPPVFIEPGESFILPVGTGGPLVSDSSKDGKD